MAAIRNKEWRIRGKLLAMWIGAASNGADLTEDDADFAELLEGDET